MIWRAGDTSRATGWLRENLQQYGGLRTPVDTITHATGAHPSEAPLAGLSGGEVQRRSTGCDGRIASGGSSIGDTLVYDQSGSRFSRKAAMPSSVSRSSMFSTMTSPV